MPVHYYSFVDRYSIVEIACGNHQQPINSVSKPKIYIYLLQLSKYRPVSEEPPDDCPWLSLPNESHH